MLRPPYSRYHHLWVYYFDRCDLPVVEHQDLIGTWVEDDCTLYFFHQCQDHLMASFARQTGARLIYQADLEYQDWEAGVDIRTFETRYLRVIPEWEFPGHTATDRLPVQLDPSVVFGSGFHPTTRLCLELLEESIRAPEPRIDSVLDLGTGTGLLAIGAARLGVEHVQCVDCNPLAVQVARKNIFLNHCEAQVQVLQADVQDVLPRPGTDLVIANLYKTLLLELFANADFWQARQYLISGFVMPMEEELLQALPLRRVRLLSRKRRDQWCCWLLASREDACVS